MIIFTAHHSLYYKILNITQLKKTILHIFGNISSEVGKKANIKQCHKLMFCLLKQEREREIERPLNSPMSSCLKKHLH